MSTLSSRLHCIRVSTLLDVLLMHFYCALSIRFATHSQLSCYSCIEFLPFFTDWFPTSAIVVTMLLSDLLRLMMALFCVFFDGVSQKCLFA